VTFQGKRAVVVAVDDGSMTRWWRISGAVHQVQDVGGNADIDR
jgi:hypothetical protein